MRKLWICALPVLLLAFAGPANAQATVLDAAAQALRSNAVYVDGGAEQAKNIDADRLRAAVRRSSSPIFIAILPSSAANEAGGNPGAVPATLGRLVGLRGTYAVLVGKSFRAASNALPTGRAETLATAAFQARSGDDPQPVLEDFVNRVSQAQSGSSGSGTGSSGDGSGNGSGSSTGSGALLLVLAAGGGGLFFWSRSRRRRAQAEERKEMAADRQLLQAELSVLGDDVLGLEPDVTVHPDARADYDAGVTRFKSAQAALEYADDQVDLVRVRRVVEEGRYAMERARAIVQGRQPPPPPPELTRPGRRNEPAMGLDDGGSPQYVGQGSTTFYGGGGWFGGGSGLLTGLMLGQMLGGGWGGGWYGGGYDNDGGNDDSDSGGGWGNDGGGGFGGGDFGGGDFGGGDFGGGGDF